MTLHTIAAENRLSEMGFFYPLQKTTPAILSSIFSRIPSVSDTAAGYAQKIERLEFRTIQGFMQGFIDLVFQSGGKYYVLDWKTNHLGNSYSDYTREHLQQCMQDAHYPLQYYIYTVALHKYLSARIDEYDYDTHFGGVFYCFVRGITPERQGNGIVYDVPPRALIDELCTLCQ